MTHYLVYWSAPRSRWVATSLLTGRDFVIESWDEDAESAIFGDDELVTLPFVPDTLRDVAPATRRSA